MSLARDVAAANGAVDHCRKSLELTRAVRLDSHEVLGETHNLAMALVAAHRFEEGLEVYSRALEMAEAQKLDAANLAYEWAGLGAALIGAGRPNQAIALLEKSLKALKQTDLEAGDLAEVKFLLAQALVAAGKDVAVAARLATEARAELEPVVGRFLVKREVDEWFHRTGIASRAPPQ
jgi:tetratricopeptide (TPR) repeat protein